MYIVVKYFIAVILSDNKKVNFTLKTTTFYENILQLVKEILDFNLESDQTSALLTDIGLEVERQDV